MPYKFTLRDAKNSGPLKTVAGVCPDSNTFRDLVNEVQDALIRRGDWWDLQWRLQMCAFNRCITWPRFVKTVLALRFANSPTEMKNRWYAVTGRGFNQGNPGGCAGGGWGTGWGGSSGYFSQFFDAYSQTQPTTIGMDNDTSPVFDDITGNQGKLIRYYVRNNNDLGKTIRIFGLAFGDQPLQEFVDGAWRAGITITAAAPFGTNATLVTKITSVLRDATSGQSYLYYYDPTLDKLQTAAQYEPSETNPRYRRTSIVGWCNNAPRKRQSSDETDTTRNTTQFEALVKLDFIPAVTDDDFLFIDVFRALKLGIQAVRLEEANQDQLARAKWLEAIEEMNMEDRDRIPSDQTVVVESVIGGGALLSPT